MLMMFSRSREIAIAACFAMTATLFVCGSATAQVRTRQVPTQPGQQNQGSFNRGSSNWGGSGQSFQFGGGSTQFQGSFGPGGITITPGQSQNGSGQVPTQAVPYQPGQQNQGNFARPGQSRAYGSPYQPGQQNQGNYVRPGQRSGYGAPWQPGTQNQGSYVPGQNGTWARPVPTPPSGQAATNYSQGVRRGNRIYYSDGSYTVVKDESSSTATTTSVAKPAAQPASPTYSQLPITITIPPEENGSCSYTLISGSQEFPYTMRAGQSQKFTESNLWKVRYDQGGGKGTKTYLVKGGGNYIFRKTTSGGWDLYKRRD